VEEPVERLLVVGGDGGLESVMCGSDWDDGMLSGVSARVYPFCVVG
jgi:hypothetical protein